MLPLRRHTYVHTRTHAHTHFCLCFYILCSRSVVPALFCHLLCCCCLNSCPINTLGHKAEFKSRHTNNSVQTLTIPPTSLPLGHLPLHKGGFLVSAPLCSGAVFKSRHGIPPSVANATATPLLGKGGFAPLEPVRCSSPLSSRTNSLRHGCVVPPPSAREA